MHGNAADVGGSSITVTGGHYNANGVTVTEVLGTAPVAGPPPTVAATEPAAAHDAVHSIDAEPVTLAAADVTIAVEDHDNPGMPDLAHQLHHTWG
jgi:hypothetical protein